ncbi:MAG: helix-turn-helix transcriptional regulator, partial [Bifidobacteriaceae bacterium]|nr:helix-turn-helix transcriptional regulator [Bifidobacteriaceae bacterium]
MAGGEAYGLEIVERLRQTPSLLENEGTIYPLLSR